MNLYFTEGHGFRTCNIYTKLYIPLFLVTILDPGFYVPLSAVQVLSCCVRAAFLLSVHFRRIPYATNEWLLPLPDAVLVTELIGICIL